ncbi:hypothetical protein GOP47_0010884 [Adiantum capillus-veneris]|uniref:Glycosyltransferase n=1 Tax=Adiantum capillus-veneris TaxID=13818 RepID=A0A9D4UVT0_ADICA|nr:hypothetical protein GOP47_0010884 [Adiantum capillus-veneris]
MASSSRDCTPHALVVPYSAPHGSTGHVVGSMLLAQSLADHGFKVNFVLFSTYYAKLKEMGTLLPLPISEASFQSSMRSVHGDGSPGSVGGTMYISTNCSDGHGNRRNVYIHVVEDNLTPHDIHKFFYVNPTMKENLYQLIVELQEQGFPLTCLVSDSFVPWTLPVAQRAGIPRVEFWTTNAMAHLLYCNIAPLYTDGVFPIKESQTPGKGEPPLMLSHIQGLPPFSAELIPGDLRFVDSSDYFVQFFIQVASCVKYGERILVHSMSELEPTAFESFKIQGIPAYAIGPLPCHTKKQETTQTDCMPWLDLQAELSVIYVAFGSFARFSVKDMQELAMGLEASESPFLWVILEDAYRREELPQVLPDGFLERTRGKGLIVSWAPQVEVLAHKAVGGFLSHCGWNSTLESMWEGIPMLCCPHYAEQRLNCHYICDLWRAGLELGRADTGQIERSFVKLGVKALLQEEEGIKARSKAQEIMQLARKTSQQGGHSFTNLQKFYDDMRVLCSKHSANSASK